MEDVYEYLFVSNEKDDIKIDGWHEISTDKIRDKSKIPELILQGVLRIKENNIKTKQESQNFNNNNNGWIKIESENDLPKDQPIDVIIDSEPYQGFVYEGYSEWFCIIENRYKSKNIEDLVEANIITHYQSIQKPKPPIY